MEALFLVLNKVDCLEELLVKLTEVGVKGGTVIDSTGMARVLFGDKESDNILGSLRMFLNPERQESKTLFFVLKHEQVELARKTIREELDLSKPDTGIMFGVDLTFIEGLNNN
ncbi:MAG: hypothetical protein RSE93_01950 [Oscillospiraceae bacterium]